MKLLRLELKRIFFTEHMWLACTAYLIISALGALIYSPSKLETENYPEKFSCGAAVFIHKSGIDWLLIFLIILLGSVVFLKRFDKGMNTILVTCPQNNMLTVIDIVIMIAAIFTLSMLSGMVKLLIYNTKFTSTSIPITSIGEDLSSYSIPLQSSKCAVYICLLSALGAVCFAAYNVFFCALIKRAVPYYTAALGSVVIPAYIFNVSYQRARAFVPISLLDAKPFFYGTQVINEDIISGNEYAFIEVTKKELAVNIIAQVFICALLFLVSAYILSGKSVPKLRKKALLCAAISALALTSCSGTVPKSDESRYIIVDDAMGVIYDKQSNRLKSVIFTPFESRIACAVSGEYIITLSFANDEKTAYNIEAVSPDTCERIPLLTVGRSINKDGFLGLDEIITLPSSWLIDFDTYGLPIGFQINDNRIYFELDDRLVCFDLDENDKRTDLLTDRAFHNAKCMGEKIYYLNSDDMLCLDESGKETIISDKPISEYELSENNVYYITAKDSLIYKNGTAISDKKAQYMLYADDSTAIFITDEGTVTVKDGAEYKTDIYADKSDGEYLYTYDGQVLEIFDLTGKDIDKQSLV